MSLNGKEIEKKFRLPNTSHHDRIRAILVEQGFERVYAPRQEHTIFYTAEDGRMVDEHKTIRFRTVGKTVAVCYKGAPHVDQFNVKTREELEFKTGVNALPTLLKIFDELGAIEDGEYVMTREAWVYPHDKHSNKIIVQLDLSAAGEAYCEVEAPSALKVDAICALLRLSPSWAVQESYKELLAVREVSANVQ